MKKKIILNLIITLLNSKMSNHDLYNHIILIRNMISIFFNKDKKLNNLINSPILPIYDKDEQKKIYKIIIEYVNL